MPDLRGVVHRFAEVRVRAMDREGVPIDMVARGLKAGTFQHEVDHLLGRLFLDSVKDTTTLCTWKEFERNHFATFTQKARAIVEKWGS